MPFILTFQLLYAASLSYSLGLSKLDKILIKEYFSKYICRKLNHRHNIVMKLRSFFLIIISALLMSGCCDKKEDVRILYWNIQNGMWADQGNNYDNFVAWINEQAPDICVWAEAESRYRTGTKTKMAGCEEAYFPYNWDLFARRYGHEYVVMVGKRDTFPQVITSKFPIRLVDRINGNGEDIIVVHGSGHAQVDVNGKTINFVTVHTYPFKYAYLAEDPQKSSEEQGGDIFRATEMKHICEESILKYDPKGKEMWMLVGDFNAIARTDNDIYKKADDDKCFMLHDYIDANTPFIDVMKTWYPDEFQHTTLSKRRIDFMYVTKPLYDVITNAETIRNGYATSTRDPELKFCYPSDHYPLVIDVRL